MKFLAGAVGLAIAVPFAVVSSAYAASVAWPMVDLQIMRELGHRWLDTGSMYLPYQLAGPYSIDVQFPLTTTPGLYPPAAGPVFAAVWALPWPLAVVFWWGVPLAIMAYAFRRWRPSLLGWALVVAMFVHPMSALNVISGGTAMWASALVAAGLLRHWPAALILLKPTLLPFALIGTAKWSRRDGFSVHRSWWIAAGVVGVLTLLGPWHDYIPVVLNGSNSAAAWSSSGSIGYSLSSVPLLLVPVVAYLTRHKPLMSGSLSETKVLGETVRVPQAGPLSPAGLGRPSSARHGRDAVDCAYARVTRMNVGRSAPEFPPQAPFTT